MLALISIWFLLAQSSFFFGHYILNKINAPILDWGNGFFIKLWIGLLYQAALLLALSLIGPIGGLGYAVVCLGTALLWTVKSQRQAFFKQLSALAFGEWIFAVFTVLLVARYCCLSVEWYDTGNYHYPLTVWMRDIGLVPGMALIYIRWALLSSWFALNAGFDYSVLFERACTVANGFSLLIVIGHFFSVIKDLISYKIKTEASIFLVGALSALLWVTFWPPHGWQWIYSTNPDFAVHATIIFICSLILLSQRTPNVLLSLPLICGLGLSLKASVLPITGFAGLAYLSSKVSRHAFFKGLLIFGLTSAPLVISNLIVSGCPIYPSSLFCTEGSTAIGKAAAANEEASMRMWNAWDRIHIPPPSDATKWNWIPSWYKNLRSNDKPIHSFIILSLISALVTIGLGLKYRNLLWILISFFSIAGCALVFVAMPNTRQMVSYLCLPIGLLTIPTVMFVSKKLQPYETLKFFSQKYIYYLLMVIFIGLCIRIDRKHRGAQLGRGIEAAKYPRSWQRPPSLINLNPNYPNLAISLTKINGMDIWVLNKGDQCWTSAQPCIPLGVQPKGKYRDASRGHKSGFERVGIN